MESRKVQAIITLWKVVVIGVQIEMGWSVEPVVDIAVIIAGYEVESNRVMEIEERSNREPNLTVTIKDLNLEIGVGRFRVLFVRTKIGKYIIIEIRMGWFLTVDRKS